MLDVEGDFEMVDFGMRLRTLRKSKNLTQKQLADQLRVTKSVISAYETDLRMPSYDILIRIAALFSVSTDYLLGITHGKQIDISALSESDSKMIMQFVDRLKNTN